MSSDVPHEQVRIGPKEAKFVKGFQTGDMVKACVTSGKKVGTYVGRVAVRTTGSFNITTAKETVQGISFKYCQAIHRMDGYSYRKGEEPLCPSPGIRTRHSSPRLKGGGLLARGDE